MPDVSMRFATRAEFRDALVHLVAVGLSSRRRRAVTIAVDEHTLLFDSGLVDSLAILELVAFVEAATGRPIPPRRIHIKHFRTIESICAAFWREEDDAAHAKD